VEAVPLGTTGAEVVIGTEVVGVPTLVVPGALVLLLLLLLRLVVG